MSLSKPEISDLIYQIRRSTPLQMFFFCFCPDASETKPILLLQPCVSGDPQRMFEAATRTISSTSPPCMGLAHLDSDDTFRFASPLFREDDITILARWVQANQNQYPDLKRLYFSQMLLVDETNKITNRYTCSQVWETMQIPKSFSCQDFGMLQESVEKRRDLYFWLTSSNANNETSFVIRLKKEEIKKIMKENRGGDSGIHGHLRYSDKGFFVFRISRLFDNFLSILVNFVRENSNLYPELMLLRNARMICKKGNDVSK